MTKRFLVALLIGFSSMLVFDACSKYEEGPSVSLRTKKARLAGTWKPEKYVDSDGNETPAVDGEGTLTFQKDGTGSVSAYGFGVPFSWEFGSGKETVNITYAFGTTSETMVWEIILLSNKELGFKDENGITTYFVAS